MRLALIIVIALGAGIGLLLPAAPSAPPAAPRTAPPPATAPAPARRVEAPRETVIARDDAGRFFAVAEVNGAPIRFIVDTGADTVALTPEDARRANIPFDPAGFAVVGMGAGGPVRGAAVRIAEVSLDGKRATDVRGVVLEGADVSLLGHSYLRQLASVTIAGDEMRLR